ncbi:MAG: hypothetical protein A2498_11870 [Lentisphaerae bacterium RIFOXYC12_FULL_60_16]|nr:MAG: hypothetical protein A2498_11870 [Lentisphaerae bacterium RIFOXYC12_FULL_60_16]OGV72582.1 MAG: hypothetical protein A2269_01135 [Lentisphaerae bacterium RIFOXYA12_FULL_60_10]
MPTSFTYEPSQWIPFRDKRVINRVRRITRKALTRHPNPAFKIRIVPDGDVEWLWVADMFHRIKTASEENRRLVLILPNPASTYRKLALMINTLRVNCRHLVTFNMDEYADQDGNVAPETWPWSFMASTKRFLYHAIDPALRPPERQMMGPTTRNIHDYSRMIRDLGGADACYSGPGWTGHLAFIEPDAPEFKAPLEVWKTFGARIVTLSPFTIAQNSLHGFFGASGDLAAVPPRAATIGPADVIAAKFRMDINALTTAGTRVSWQRFMTRLVSHGPVTPRVPSSILQTLPTDSIISETIADDVQPDWNMEY